MGESLKAMNQPSQTTVHLANERPFAMSPAKIHNSLPKYKAHMSSTTQSWIVKYRFVSFRDLDIDPCGGDWSYFQRPQALRSTAQIFAAVLIVNLGCCVTCELGKSPAFDYYCIDSYRTVCSIQCKWCSTYTHIGFSTSNISFDSVQAASFLGLLGSFVHQESTSPSFD